MERRVFGRTGLEVSRLTFGCGAVGGLMTKGDPADQDRAIAWARDNGINFFDTAASYGNGASEENLGRALGGIEKIHIYIIVGYTDLVEQSLCLLAPNTGTQSIEHYVSSLLALYVFDFHALSR